jgi:molybdopterin-containing oxidoreductase family membrane subunit
MTKGPLAFNFWIVEMLFGMIVPMILLLYKPTRLNRFSRMSALLLVAAGVVAFRWDTNMAGFLVIMPSVTGQAVTYTSYTPSLIEILTGAAIIAYGLAGFSIGVRYLRVVDHTLVEEQHEQVKVKATEPLAV